MEASFASSQSQVVPVFKATDTSRPNPIDTNAQKACKPETVLVAHKPSPLTPPSSIAGGCTPPRPLRPFLFHPIFLTRQVQTNKIIFTETTTQYATSPQDCFQKSHTSLSTSLSATKAPLDRLTLAVAGLLFKPTSPAPYGGTKKAPGFLKFKGTSASDLLRFMVSEAVAHYWKFGDKKALGSLVKAANRVLGMQYLGRKDLLDETMLKGMKKSGLIPWVGAARIPAHLRHVDEDCV
ncbi:hypothetical protein HDU99_002671, partial [Rhizoclosmatium hyalinum]